MSIVQEALKMQKMGKMTMRVSGQTGSARVTNIFGKSQKEHEKAKHRPRDMNHYTLGISVLSLD